MKNGVFQQLEVLLPMADNQIDNPLEAIIFLTDFANTVMTQYLIYAMREAAVSDTDLKEIKEEAVINVEQVFELASELGKDKDVNVTTVISGDLSFSLQAQKLQ